MHELGIDGESAGGHERDQIHDVCSKRTIPPPAERRGDAIVLAAVKGEARAPALRPPLTAAARDGGVDRERDGGMSRVFREQRNDGNFAQDAP